MEKSKIVIQNIVAHVMNPTDHIILMATIDEEGILGLGSVGNIFIKNQDFNQNFIVALLNSKLFSWFAYRFIYGKAIRTMRFDQHHLNKFALPLSEFENIKNHLKTIKFKNFNFSILYDGVRYTCSNIELTYRSASKPIYHNRHFIA